MDDIIRRLIQGDIGRLGPNFTQGVGRGVNPSFSDTQPDRFPGEDRRAQEISDRIAPEQPGVDPSYTGPGPMEVDHPFADWLERDRAAPAHLSSAADGQNPNVLNDMAAWAERAWDDTAHMRAPAGDFSGDIAATNPALAAQVQRDAEIGRERDQSRQPPSPPGRGLQPGDWLPMGPRDMSGLDLDLSPVTPGAVQAAGDGAPNPGREAGLSFGGLGDLGGDPAIGGATAGGLTMPDLGASAPAAGLTMPDLGASAPAAGLGGTTPAPAPTARGDGGVDPAALKGPAKLPADPMGEDMFDPETNTRPDEVRQLGLLERVFGEKGSDKYQNAGKALMMAGAAIMSNTGSLGEAIGAGIQTGLMTYDEAMQALRDEEKEARQMGMIEEAHELNMALKRVQLQRAEAGTRGKVSADSTEKLSDVQKAMVTQFELETLMGLPSEEARAQALRKHVSAYRPPSAGDDILAQLAGQ